MADTDHVTGDNSEHQQLNGEGPASALDAYFAEYYKSRFVYSLAGRIRRARKFIAEGAYIDEALQKYNLPDEFYAPLRKQFPNSERPDPFKDDEFSSFKEILRYLRMPSPD